MKKLSTLFTGVALALFASSAFADDLVPPLWRGSSGSTFQEWEFLTDTTYAFPVQASNPYGTPFALINDHQYIGVDPVPDPDRVGIFSLSGVMAFYVPNNVNPYDKYVQVQVTWRVTNPPINPFGQPTPVVGLADDVGNAYDLDLVSTLALASGWSLSVYQGTIDKNPPFEIVGLAGDIDVDQVVIDTLCVPEPQTYGLLAGLGLLGFGVWRRLNS